MSWGSVLTLCLYYIGYAAFWWCKTVLPGFCIIIIRTWIVSVQIFVTISVLSFILSTPFFWNGWWSSLNLWLNCIISRFFWECIFDLPVVDEILQIVLNVCDYSRTLKTYLVVYIILIKTLCCSVRCFPHLTNSLYIIGRFLEVYNWVSRNYVYIFFYQKVIAARNKAGAYKTKSSELITAW